MLSFTGDDNTPIRKHYFGLNKIIDAQSVKTAKEAKTSKKHHSRANRMSSTGNWLLSHIFCQFEWKRYPQRDVVRHRATSTRQGLRFQRVGGAELVNLFLPHARTKGNISVRVNRGCISEHVLCGSKECGRSEHGSG